MNLEERQQQSKPYRSFRTSLDIGMGMFYIVIGLLMLYARYFGTVALPRTYAYILGSLMLLYGAFRIYRGMVVVLRNSRQKT